MRKSEQKLWDAMKRRAPQGWWLQRVENLMGAGMPDVLVVSPTGRSCWIELKAPTKPKRPTTPLLGNGGLRCEQINWHIKARDTGLSSCVLARDDQGGLYLVGNEHAAYMNAMSVDQLLECSVANHWDGVWEILA